MCRIASSVYDYDYMNWTTQIGIASRIIQFVLNKIRATERYSV